MKKQWWLAIVLLLFSYWGSSPLFAETVFTDEQCAESKGRGGLSAECRVKFALGDGCIGTERVIGECNASLVSFPRNRACCVSDELLVNTTAICEAEEGKCSEKNDGTCSRLNGNLPPGQKYDPIGTCDAPNVTCCKVGAATGSAGANENCERTLSGLCTVGNNCPAGKSNIGICGPDPSSGSTRICCGTPTNPPDESSLGLQNYTLLEEIPGQSGASGNLAKYLESLYKFTFWAIGIAALFMLTVGGFMYVTSAGNTARIGTAKTIIVDALLGLIIALFAWLFLYVLNPDLVEGLKLPGLSQVNVSSGTGAGTPAASSTARGNCPNPPDTSANCCPQSASITCQACSDCIAVPPSVPNKGCGLSTCYLNRSLLAKIQAISGVSGWRVTESWPPTVYHASNCHTRGTCADINNSGGETDPDTIKRYYDAFRTAGLNVLYEHARDCAPYTAKGINCKSYPQQTNLSSFHVQ